MTDRPPITPQLAQTRVVAILRGTTAVRVVKASLALVEGGITCVELTLNTAGAVEAITELRTALPAGVAIGAGTVLDAGMAVAAMDAGAEFLVSPSVAIDVVQAGLRREIPSYPGAYTPTEILSAWRAGAIAVGLGGPLTGDLDGDIDTAALTDRARRLLAAVAAVPGGGGWQ